MTKSQRVLSPFHRGSRRQIRMIREIVVAIHRWEKAITHEVAPWPAVKDLATPRWESDTLFVALRFRIAQHKAMERAFAAGAVANVADSLDRSTLRDDDPVAYIHCLILTVAAETKEFYNRATNEE